MFQGSLISPPGELKLKADVASEPSVSTEIALNGTLYTVVMIDPDAKLSGTSIKVLHWVQSNLRSIPGSKNETASYHLTNTDRVAAIAPYLGPQPPAETPARAHRYIELLFEQPEPVVKFPDSFQDVLTHRFGANVTQDVMGSNLGRLVAGNWFTVRNDSAVAPFRHDNDAGRIATNLIWGCFVVFPAMLL